MMLNPIPPGPLTRAWLLAVTLAGWIVTLTKIRFGRMKKHWETLEAREHRWPTRKTMGNHEQL